MVVAVKYRILVSCPGDVGEYYMPRIKNAIEDYNANLERNSTTVEHFIGYVPSFETIYWIDNTTPVLDYGKSAQEVIDEQLVDTVDGTIAFFFSRLGKETGGFPSGTVEEIERTNDRNRPVSIICIRPDAFPESLLGDGNEYKKLQEYINSFETEKKGFVAIIPPDKIQSTVERILNRIVLKYYDDIGGTIKDLLLHLK